MRLDEDLKHILCLLGALLVTATLGTLIFCAGIATIQCLLK